MQGNDNNATLPTFYVNNTNNNIPLTTTAVKEKKTVTASNG